jgi:zinc-ribbon domain
MPCSWCGNDVSPYAKFCPKCGEPDPWDSPSSSSSASPSELKQTNQTSKSSIWVWPDSVLGKIWYIAILGGAIFGFFGGAFDDSMGSSIFDRLISAILGAIACAFLGLIWPITLIVILSYIIKFGSFGG